MENTNIDKVLARAAKLMAVQENRGSSEAEATVAAEHLQRLLQEHNLTLSQIEQHSAEGDVQSKRVKDDVKMAASKRMAWRLALLKGIAQNNFCLAVQSGPYTTPKRTMIVGREVNVNVTKMTYDYLAEAFIRAAKEAGFPIWTKAVKREFGYFMDGAVSRVIERLDQRRREAEAESRNQPVSGNGSHQELVLSDVYGSEADLNNDALNGFPAGTTATRRRESAEKETRISAEIKRLEETGVPWINAWYLARGYSEEQAAEWARQYKRQSQRGGRGGRASGFSRRNEAEYRKVNSTAYKSGRSTGSSIGLDSQVGGGNPRRIG